MAQRLFSAVDRACWQSPARFSHKSGSPVSAPCSSIRRARLTRPRRSQRWQATSSMVSLHCSSLGVIEPRALIAVSPANCNRAGTPGERPDPIGYHHRRLRGRSTRPRDGVARQLSRWGVAGSIFGIALPMAGLRSARAKRKNSAVASDLTRRGNAGCPQLCGMRW
jgi:hypothetical protein